MPRVSWQYGVQCACVLGIWVALFFEAYPLVSFLGLSSVLVGSWPTGRR